MPAQSQASVTPSHDAGAAPRAALSTASLARLYDRARAGRWQLAREDFAAALGRSVRHRFGAAADFGSREVAAYLESLHLEDLALAAACGRGLESAWEHFVAEFRPALHAAARAIAGPAVAAELADSIYAELFGLEEREVNAELRRRSLFEYFHGRSKLTTWLRAVLAQRHVDAVRAARRLESLDAAEGQAEESPAARLPAPSAVSPPDPDRGRYLEALEATLRVTLEALEPRERLRLALYYADGRTLAEIGRITGEHEATVSRKLARALRDLRKRIERALREEKRLSAAQIRLCFEYAVEEWPFDLTASLGSAELPRNP